jgi:4-amino-4-deoxy-L-arabinose transferase-like glycosyltransferase
MLSFLAITGITFFKNALELEDAEQAYYSQWLRWGYDDQPPLYAWLQYLINQIFGVQKGSFSVLRGAIFASILVSLAHFGKIMRLNEKKSELAVFTLVLVPVFIDFTFRRLSHTSLLCLVILLSFIVIQRLLQDKTWINYALLGFVVGIGVLSKYNYVLFLVAFGLVLFFDNGLRQIFFNKKMLLSIVLAGLLLAPHAYWLLGPDGYFTELRDSIALKTESKTSTVFYGIGPLFSLLLTFLKLMAPLLVVVAIAYVLKRVSFSKPKTDWFMKFGLVQLSVLLLFFIVFNVQKVEERWLLPLLLPFVVLLIRWVEFKSIHKWSSGLFQLFLLVIAIQVVRTPIEKILDIRSSVHYGFEPLSEVLNNRYATKKWILPNVTYGGNVRVLNRDSEVWSKDDFSLPVSKRKNIDGVEVLIGKENLMDRIPFERLVDFGKEKDTLFILLLLEGVFLYE